MMKRNLTVALGLAASLVLAGCGSGSDHAAPAAAEQAADPVPGTDHSTMAGMDHSQMGGESEGDGRHTEHGGYRLSAVTAPRKAGKPGTLEFTILGAKNKPHKEFVLELTKLMHVYVVRADLTNFQHLHPELDEKTGGWTVPLTLEAAGPYRLVTEFDALDAAGNLHGRRLGTTFTVKGAYKKEPFEPSLSNGVAQDLSVSVAGEPKVGANSLSLTVRRGGQDLSALQPYLASWAHITGFRKGDLRVVHVHPNESPEDESTDGGPNLTLAPTFDAPGTYRLFVQVKVDEAVRLIVVDLKVS